MKRFISNSVLAAVLLSVASYGQTTITSVPYTISASGTYTAASFEPANKETPLHHRRCAKC